ncbi:MAG: serine/threonine protein kinase [Planctomycetes bacterium]|nr:serine/threonine protein kinase [Planctomycetota bacterium]
MADDPATPPDPAPAGEAPRKRRRAEGDLTSSDVGEAPKKRRRAEGDLTSSDAAEAPRRRRRAEGDLTSSDVGDAPRKRRRAEGDLTSSDAAEAPRPRSKRAVAQTPAEPPIPAADVPLGEPAAAAAPEPPSPEREAEDALVGLFAVKEGLVSEAQVEKAIAKQRAAEGPAKPLARLLVETGALSLQARDQVLARLDPEVIPGYRIEGEAGRGGMGVVYRARQLSMDRVVAVKVLSRRLSDDPSYVTKFLAEARSAGKLNHENVVAAIDAGAAAGLHYFVMEFVSGRSAAEAIEQEGPLPWPKAFEVAEQVARGLAHAHQAGLVHRDVKPENVLLTTEGRAKLCDLGLAKAAQIAGTGGKSDMTEGTPYYCSPEQATGRTDIDARSDVYSLGATLYHMLKGEPPFDGESARAILVKQVREPFPDLDVVLPEVPPALRRLLAEMVKKDREQRLPSMRAFEERLVAARRAAVAAPPPARRGGGKGPLVLAGGVFVVFLALGALGAMALLGDPPTDVAVKPPPPPDPVAPPDDDPEEVVTPVRPRVTRVTDPPTTTPPPRPPEVTTTTERPVPSTGPAATALAEAGRLAAQDPAAARDAYAEVARRFPGAPEADEARRLADGLTKAAFDQGYKRFEALTTQTIALVRDGRFRDAAEAVDAFAAAWEPRGLPGLGEQVGNLRRAIEQQAQVRVDDALRRLDAAKTPEERAEAERALEDVVARVPDTSATAARPRLEALARDRAAREAEAALAPVLARRDEALRRGDRAAAARALEAALDDPALVAVGERLVEARAELDLLATAWDAVDAACRRLGEDERGRFRLRQGEPLRGRLVDYDPAAWRGRVKLQGLKEEVPLDLRDLHPDELVGLALPPEQGRANVLLFLARGAPEAAAAALAAWVAAGGAPAPALQARVQQALAAGLEVQAAQRLDAVLADGAPADVVLGLPALLQDEKLRATAAYRERFDRLKDAFRRARVAQLQAAPELLFKGELKAARRGDAVTIKYTFKDPAQLQDWTPDVRVDAASAARHADDGMIVKGKLSHVAVFQGGELGVEVRASTSNGRQPNLNVVLGDRGGWTGVLLGLGFQYGALQDLRVDPTAPRKPGYTVPLPANVCVVLDGREPRVDGPNFAAEPSPSVQNTQGRAHKFDAARAADGAVRLRLRGRDVFRLPPLPDWERPGSVAIAPFATEVNVHEVEIAGRLDEAWISARAQALALIDANRLPTPPAPR